MGAIIKMLFAYKPCLLYNWKDNLLDGYNGVLKSTIIYGKLEQDSKKIWQVKWTGDIYVS